MLATAAGVNASAVTLTVSAGSVVVTSEIIYESSAAAATGVSAMASGVLASASALQTALSTQFAADGISGALLTVEAITAPPTATIIVAALPAVTLTGWAYDALGRLVYPAANTSRLPASRHVLPGAGTNMPTPRPRVVEVTYRLPPVACSSNMPCAAQPALPRTLSLPDAVTVVSSSQELQTVRSGAGFGMAQLIGRTFPGDTVQAIPDYKLGYADIDGDGA